MNDANSRLRLAAEAAIKRRPKGLDELLEKCRTAREERDRNLAAITDPVMRAAAAKNN